MVEGELEHRWPQVQPSKFPRSLPHLVILSAKVIGTRTQNTKSQKHIYWYIIWTQIVYK